MSEGRPVCDIDARHACSGSSWSDAQRRRDASHQPDHNPCHDWSQSRATPFVMWWCVNHGAYWDGCNLKQPIPSSQATATQFLARRSSAVPT
eukprot:scaffold37832_cov46-Phaeocystis_antarctica.AAC.1